jgi:hypothetical protein
MSEPRPRTESELVELVRSIDAPAPDALHREVRALVSTRQIVAPRAGRLVLARGPLAATALAAVLAAVLAIALSAGGNHATLSLREASAPTLRPATAAAPPESPSNDGQLAAAVDGVSFPYWEERFGWRSTGARSDRIAGHAMTTVFYADARGRRIGYAIVAGAPPRIGGGAVTWHGRVPYRLSVENGVSVVTWLRDGHLCVVSGRGVSGATLLRLASWSKRPSPSVAS